MFRCIQCFEYKKRLDECSVPVRRLNEEPAVRPNRESWCNSRAHSAENREFSTVAGRLSGRRSFVQVGAFFRGVNS